MRNVATWQTNADLHRAYRKLLRPGRRSTRRIDVESRLHRIAQDYPDIEPLLWINWDGADGIGGM